MVDYSDAVELLIKSDSEKIKNEIFNVGYQNLSIYQIAKLVKKVVENQFSEKTYRNYQRKSDDNRSYHINSDKIKEKLNLFLNELLKRQ